MSTSQDDLMVAFEIHQPDQIRQALKRGVDPNAPIHGKRPISQLIEMYFRSDRFPECLRVMLEAGATPEDASLLPVLLDEPEMIRKAVQDNPHWLTRRVSLPSTFTPLEGASMLHVAAEYGHLKAARALVELGAEVDARAATDSFGMNGHTPLFHTVNSNKNRSASLMHFLLEAGAQPDLRLNGIVWGKGFEWETTCLDVTPISYAQLGLLPQMHRREEDCYANVRVLLEAANRPIPPMANVPNRYLTPKPS